MRISAGNDSTRNSTMSRTEIIKAGHPCSLVTGTCRNPPTDIMFNAQASLASIGSDSGSRVITSDNSTSTGLRPESMIFKRTSRSVKIPDSGDRSDPSSVTSTQPLWRLRIACMAVFTESVGARVSGGRLGRSVSGSESRRASKLRSREGPSSK